MVPVTLMDILDARDRRVQRQQRLLTAYGCPLLSFTMNIPGPVKNSALIRRAFDVGMERLQAALKGADLTTLAPETLDEPTGCEYLCVVPEDPKTIKALCEAIEDGSPLGRLFDMDVLDKTGHKLSRSQERGCLICGAAGRGCASRRLHSVEDLQRATEQRLREGLQAADEERIGTLVTRALLDEVDTTPKPGLVDRNNNGSHRDMTRQTFYDSSAALSDYWPDCFRIGVESASLPPEETFSRLRTRGLDAEKKMFRATGGVNTHKGAIFILGTICGAIGRLWSAEAPCYDPKRIGEECAAMSAAAVEYDFEKLRLQERPGSFGERAYLEHGIRGARGEVSDGLPTVITVALPKLREALDRGLSWNDAGAITLLYLIAQGGDTNMIRRGGLSGAAMAVKEVQALLACTPFPDSDPIRSLDDWFIAQNLSPGGSADLLAASLLLLNWQGILSRNGH